MTVSTNSNATPGKFTKGANTGTLVCDDCGARKQVANMAVHTAKGHGVCVPCYDKAGDDNSVSDGHMTCAEFRSKYGTHSEYCDGTDKENDMTKDTITAKDDPIDGELRDHAGNVIATGPVGTLVDALIGDIKRKTAPAKAPRAARKTAAPTTQADKVRAYLTKHADARPIDVEKATGVPASYVWDVRAAMRKKGTIETPKVAKAKVVAKKEVAKALHIDHTTGATILTPKASKRTAARKAAAKSSRQGRCTRSNAVGLIAANMLRGAHRMGADDVPASSTGWASRRSRPTASNTARRVSHLPSRREQHDDCRDRSRVTTR